MQSRGIYCLSMASVHLVDLVCRNVRTVALTGAGISAESGVPTFRGGDNSLWSKFDPHVLASIDGFMSNPSLVWEWYLWRRKLVTETRPNRGHEVLALLEKRLKNFRLITQNVDNLHRRAGSEQVIELHGNIHRNKCLDCGSPFPEIEFEPDNIPVCSCGGRMRPDVVWFGEMLPEQALDTAIELSRKAELFFSIGTSAEVFPAADLPLIAKRNGAYLVEINPDETRISDFADERLRESSSEALSSLWRKVENSIVAC